MADSDLKQRMAQLKTELMRTAATAMFNGLHPLGMLTATLSTVDEQVYCILRGAALKQQVLPSDDGTDVVAEYYAIVQELLMTTQAHAAELYALAQRLPQATPAPEAATAQREVAELQRLFEGLDMRSRKLS